MKELEELKLRALVDHLRCVMPVYRNCTDYEILDAVIRAQIFLNESLLDNE